MGWRLGSYASEGGWEGRVKFGLKHSLLFETDFDASECRRDQRRLEAHTLPVTYTRVRDRVVGVWDGVWGSGWRGEGGVGWFV